MKLRRKRFLSIVIGVFALSVGGGVAIWQEGVASDCRPEQIDGQCGLSSAMGTLFGIGFFLGVNLIMAAIMLILHLRSRDVRTSPDH